MKTPRMLIAAAILFLAAGCKPYFLVSDFDNRTATHKSVAILPFEMVFTGKKPEKLTDDEMKLIAEAESKAFMISLYNEVLRSTRNGKKPIRVDMQHFDKTLSLLKTNTIALNEVKDMDAGRLSELLGVDAVVKCRVVKHRLMSDLASYGIDLGVHIINILSHHTVWLWMPHELSRSKAIHSSYSLIDKTGNTLWSIAYDVDADWRQTSDKIIDEVNRKSARRFPYRVK